MKFMVNVLLAESSQKCSAVLLDKICQIAQTGCLVRNGINLLVGPGWEDWLESDNQKLSTSSRETSRNIKLFFFYFGNFTYCIIYITYV